MNGDACSLVRLRMFLWLIIALFRRRRRRCIIRVVSLLVVGWLGGVGLLGRIGGMGWSLSFIITYLRQISND